MSLVCGSKVRVQAADGDSPPKTDSTVVMVTVDRNLYAPTFTRPSVDQQLQDTINIKETESFQNVLYTLNGQDSDNMVSYRSMMTMFLMTRS